MFPRLLGLVAAACLAASCSNSADGPTQPSGPVTLERFGRTDASLTYSSAIAAPLRAVVRDATTWRGAWATIWGDVSPAPALPTVDFSRDMVVVAALGQRPTGGFSIVIAD